MNNIVFEHVVKAYGKNVIVNDLNMEIREGERLILLGPSGCGKSTTLRMIAGLEDITSGSLHMRGQVVNNVACGDRGVSMVFQNYALFPHMTVKNNIIYGLKAHKMEAAEINRRLEEVLEMLQLKGLEDRKPKDLSGGQRQRVALARAVVKRSDYFLLDEPLSNLDAQLRLRARKELVKIHEMYRPTMVYVTHDQIEAMTVGQRVAIMYRGNMEMLDAKPCIQYAGKYFLCPIHWLSVHEHHLLPVWKRQSLHRRPDDQTGSDVASDRRCLSIRKILRWHPPGTYSLKQPSNGNFHLRNRKIRGGLWKPLRSLY